MKGRFQDVETAMGYYPQGLFEMLKDAGRFGPEGEDSDKFTPFLLTVNGLQQQMIVTMAMHGQRELALGLKAKMDPVHTLLNTLTEITEEQTTALQERKNLALLKEHKNAFGEMAKAFRTLATPMDDMVVGQTVVSEPMASHVRQMAEGLEAVQEAFDRTVGALIAPKSKTQLSPANIRRLQGEATRFISGHFPDDAIAATSWGSLYDTILQNEGRDAARELLFFHGVNRDHLAAAGLLLKEIRQKNEALDALTPRFEEALAEANAAFEAISQFQTDSHHSLRVMRIKKPFSTLAQMTELVADALTDVPNYLPELMESGHLPKLAAQMKDTSDIAQLQSIIERLPNIAEGYEAIQARYDATLGRQTNALRDSTGIN